MTRNEIRVSDQDSELAALKALRMALEPLAQDARTRVLAWAQAAYGEGRFERQTTKALENMTALLKMLNDAAAKAGVEPQHFEKVAYKMIEDATMLAEQEWVDQVAGESS